MLDVKNKNVTIVGLGKTAVSLARLLLREGAMPIVSDAENPSSLQQYKDELEKIGVPYECGSHSPLAFRNCRMVIPSPGVPPAIKPIAEAVANGAELVSELDFAFSRCARPIIAVTGTNGKTTTTELIAAMFRACGHTISLAGNNAYPFSQAILDGPDPDYYVLEVSSYQLETTRIFHPWIGLVLNVTEDHLGRHKSLQRYAAEKGKLLAQQSSSEIAVLNADDALVADLGRESSAAKCAFSMRQRVDNGAWLEGASIRWGDEEIARVDDVPLPGRHNLANALAALTVCRAGEFDGAGCLQGLRAFSGVEHRLEYVAAVDGVEYVNDSKSTNLDSLRVALESFERPIVLIAGGRGKGGDYGALAPLVRERVKALVAIGEDAPRIEAAWSKDLCTVNASGMDEAVCAARDHAENGDIVLLSPGCASFDWYVNFEERGRAFKQAVQRLANGRPVAAGA